MTEASLDLSSIFWFGVDNEQHDVPLFVYMINMIVNMFFKSKELSHLLFCGQLTNAKVSSNWTNLTWVVEHIRRGVGCNIS